MHDLHSAEYAHANECFVTCDHGELWRQSLEWSRRVKNDDSEIGTSHQAVGDKPRMATNVEVGQCVACHRLLPGRHLYPDTCPECAWRQHWQRALLPVLRAIVEQLRVAA